MKRNTHLIRFSVFIIIFSFICLSFLHAQKIKVKTEDGVQVVYNPKQPAPPPGTPKKLILTPELIIGEEEAGDFVFAEIRTIQVDEQENIYVLDPKEICVKIFSKNGKCQRTFGKKGQGPGEWQNPWQMYLTAEKEIMIFDSTNRRLSYYSLDGKYLKEISIGAHTFLRTIPDSKGNIIVEVPVRGEKRVYEIKKFDPELNPGVTVATIEDEKISNVINLASPVLAIRVMSNDCIAWSFTSKYELIVVNPEGKTIRKIVKEYNPIKITDAEKEEIIKRNFGAPGVPPLPPGFKIKFPENYPAFYYFACDDEGRMYVRTYEKDEKGNFCYDVFDPEGRYITKLFLPENEIIYVIKKNKMYIVIRENEEGIPVVKRYNMGWH